MVLRLAKYLAQAGVASRRKAEEFIDQGRIKVNGLIIREQGFIIDEGKDTVEFDDKIVLPENKVYLLLNKPSGYISSASDPWGRTTVLELVKDVQVRVYPVGRLDYDTRGVLLLSNDGEFTNRMIHPRYNITKIYRALIEGRIHAKQIKHLQDGVNLEDGLTAPATVRLIELGHNTSLIEMEIHEGRNRQVKRMCAAVGHPVIELERTAFAFLNLAGVKSGQYRHLSAGEVERLCSLSGFHLGV